MGKGGSVTIGYRYNLTAHMGLGAGPYDALIDITADKKSIWPKNQAPLTDNATIAINAPDVFGGDKSEGGIVGKLTLLMGGPDQMPSDALAVIEPGPRPAYRGVVSCAFTGQMAAMNPYIKPWAFRVARYVKGWSTPVWLPGLAKIDRGMNAAHIIYQCLTDTGWGGGEDPDTGLDLASFATAAQTLFDEGFGLCLKWSMAGSLGDFIGTVLDHIGAMRYIDPATDKLGIRLLRADYDPVAMAADPANILDEADIVEMSRYQNPALNETVNTVTVKYHDLATDKDASVTYENPANIMAQGKVVSDSVEYKGLWNGDQAARKAASLCHSKSALLISGSCKVKSTRWAIKVGDVLLLNWAKEKCVLMPIRILQVDYGDATARTITLNWAQDEFGTPATAYIKPVETEWAAPDTTPQPITVQRLIEVPYRELARTMDSANLQTLAPDAGFVAGIAGMPPGIPYGFRLTTRTGTADYVDRAHGDFCATGTLATAIGPTDTTITLAAHDDLSRVATGTAALLDDELVRVDAVDTTTGVLTIGRGCADTVPAPHAQGARLWCYQDYAAVDRTEYAGGETVSAKLLTQTGQGTLDSALATPVTQTMQERQIRPYPPGGLKINGAAYPAFTSAALVLTWSHRDRTLQADQLVDTTAGNVGPEAGTTYTVKVYLDGVLDSTTSGITANTLTPTVSGNGSVRVEITSQRDGYDCWQVPAATFDYTVAPPAALTLAGTYPAATIGAAYSADLTISGGSGAYSNPRLTAGQLPAGLELSLVDTALRVSGMTTGTETQAFVVAVDSSDGQTATSSQSISSGIVLLTLTGAYADATVGVPYSSELTIAGGSGVYGNPDVVAGALPAWATLQVVDDKLRVSGTPDGGATTINVTVSVDSSDGQTASSAQSFDVIVAFTPVAFDPTYCHSTVSLSNQNYTASRAASGYTSVYGAAGKAAGKWQVEARVTAIGGTVDLGVADKSQPGTGDERGILDTYAGNINGDGAYSAGIWTIGGNAYLFRNDGTTVINSQGAGSLATGDYLSACVDLDAHTIAFYKNGVLITGTNVTLASRTWFPCASLANGGSLSLTNGPLVHPIAGYAQWG